MFPHPPTASSPTLLKTPLAGALAGHPFGPRSTTALSPSVDHISHTCDMEIALQYIMGFLSDYSSQRNDSDGPEEFLTYALEILNGNNLSFQKQSQSLLKCKKYILVLHYTAVLLILVSKINHSICASAQFRRATLANRF